MKTVHNHVYPITAYSAHYKTAGYKSDIPRLMWGITILLSPSNQNDWILLIFFIETSKPWKNIFPPRLIFLWFFILLSFIIFYTPEIGKNQLLIQNWFLLTCLTFLKKFKQFYDVIWSPKILQIHYKTKIINFYPSVIIFGIKKLSSYYDQDTRNRTKSSFNSHNGGHQIYTRGILLYKSDIPLVLVK